MLTKKAPQRVYAAENGQAVIVCARCTEHTPIDARPYLDSHKSLKVRCRCGNKFPIVFNTRNFYRKEVHLPGQYAKSFGDVPDLLTIEDMSYTGIKFKTGMSHKIEVDDVLTIEFRLDNRRRTRIVKTARVMHVMGGTIGAEFRERQAYSTELTYYLNAS